MTGKIGVLGHCQDDEPVFVLVGRDKAAPDTIRRWAVYAVRLGCDNPEKIAGAFRVADDMEKWQKQHSQSAKVPD